MINGGVKFFERSKSLYSDGTTASATSSSDAAKNILSLNNYVEWRSLFSNDSITEEIIVTLNSPTFINRIILTEMNFKNFSILFDNGNGYEEFTNVIGANGISLTGINVVDNNVDGAYFEFDLVEVQAIKIVITSTIIPDQDKFLCKFIATREIGTLRGFPRVDSQTNSNDVENKTMSGRVLTSKGMRTAQIKINFKTHPYQEDITLIEYLFNLDESFLIYPCGGRYGEKYFKINQTIWKLSDIYNVQTSGNLDSDFEKGVYLIGVNKNITFKEHI